MKLGRGTPVYLAGDDTGGVFGIVDGLVELHLPAPGGSATLAHIGRPGAWFGDLAALRGHPRRFSLVTRTNARLLRLSRSELQRLCDDVPGRWRYVADLVADNLSIAIDVVEALRRRDVVERTALNLLAVADDTGDLSVTQTDLAELACLSRGTINGALAALEERGLVKRHYREVEIRSLDGLARLVGKA
ncbi:Crp/Fnr family transcriptional regulator [Salipiger sp. HF18]|uniref:Crp/Fnr family transcriptional regulator n=1 Tax=Salipiger sp. HF18 TaxID=2721557 RepID=UPI00142E14B2|nr:Crp/Fnr family transcriptional regulator [Salipiger sp. HF18]